MYLSILTFTLAFTWTGLAFAQGFVHASEGPNIDIRSELKCPEHKNAEAILKLAYSVHCDEKSPGFDNVRGFVTLEGGSTSEPVPTKFVFDLFMYRNQTEISLGSVQSGAGNEAKVPTYARIQVNRVENGCQLFDFKEELSCEPINGSGPAEGENANANANANYAEAASMEQMALMHAPFINFRNDQYIDQQISDIPLVMSYSVLNGDPKRNTKKIQYIVIFSDEDVQTNVQSIQEQAARYGRTTDIEWIYEIEFTPDLKLVNQIYQGRLHRARRFVGKYLAGSMHPILYDASSNNIFSDQPISRRQINERRGHLLVPRHRLSNSLAREWVMFQEPWTFKVSWAEMVRSHRSSVQVKPENQLYIFAHRNFYLGRLDRLVELSGGEAEALEDSEGISRKSTGWDQTSPMISRLRDNLWHLAQTYRNGELFTAIPIGQKNLDKIEAMTLTAKFRTNRSSWIQNSPSKNKNSSIRFFRLIPMHQTFFVKEITDRIQNLFY